MRWGLACSASFGEASFNSIGAQYDTVPLILTFRHVAEGCVATKKNFFELCTCTAGIKIATTQKLAQAAPG